MAKGINQKKILADNLAKNLPTLRARLGISQTELCEKIGITRQTLASIENSRREMTWITFVALTLLFMQNDETKVLLPILGIHNEQLQNFLSFRADSLEAREIGLLH